MTKYWLGKQFSDEHRKKLSEAHQGKTLSEEHRRKISNALKGKPKTKGNKLSDETRRRMSEARKGHPVSRDTRRKISKGRKGMTFSDTHRENIGKAGIGRIPWNKGKKLGPQSPELRKRHSVSVKGERHYNWQGGKTRAIMVIRRSIETRLWREAVFERDNYTCQKCSRRGAYLHAHHIKPFAKYPDLRFDVSNGETLCRSCHRELHATTRHVNKP
jgi:hypothetical protein